MASPKSLFQSLKLRRLDLECQEAEMDDPGRRVWGGGGQELDGCGGDGEVLSEWEM